MARRMRLIWKIKENNRRGISNHDNFYHCFIYGYSEITVPLMHLTCKGTPWHLSDECHSTFEHLKRLSPQLQSYPLDPRHSNHSQDWCLRLCTCSCPFNYNSWWWIAPHCIPLLDLFFPGTQLQCPWQRATHNFWRFQMMVTLSQRLWTSVWCGHYWNYARVSLAEVNMSEGYSVS